MKTLLISLVSDQTLPNVQLIKEMKTTITDYLFISTQVMEKKGCRKWIENAAGITASTTKIVDQFSFDDITEKLNEVDLSLYAKLIVNLTGGTKVMTLVAYEYFKNEGAEVYYITGADNEYIKVFPGKKKQKIKFNTSITLEEYLKSYGFDIEQSASSGILYEYTCRFLEMYCEGKLDNEIEALSFLRSKRQRGVKKEDYGKVDSLIEKLNFQTATTGELSTGEVKYLTGEWFEEYIGETIKREYSLTDENIFIGVKLKKELPAEKTNPVQELLGNIELLNSPDNEFDVMFIYKDRFYVIECKTSIIDMRKVEGKNGEFKYKDFNILGETIYKSEALKSKFGLFAQSYIFTLTDFKKYVESDKNKIKQIEELVNRATLGKIKIVGREQIFANSHNLTKLL